MVKYVIASTPSGFVYISDYLTPFGMTTISQPSFFYFDGLYKVGSVALTTSFNYPSVPPNSIISPMTAKNSPYYDIVALSTNNLVYISDNFILPAPTIPDYVVDPCLGSTWNLSTNVEVSVQVKSTNNLYNVIARAILYFGDLNQQDSGWSTNVTSGSYLTFNFIANKTIQNGILRIEGNDVNNNGIVSADIPFSVSTNGVIFGSCQTHGSITPPVSLSTNVTANNTYLGQPITNTNNPLAQSFKDLANAFFLTPTLLLLLLLFLLDLGLFIGVIAISFSIKHTDHFVPSMVGIGVLDIIIIIISTLMGLISSALVISILAMLVIIGAIFLATRLNKSSTGGTGGA